MATILFYSPFNQRARDAESLMIAFHGQNNRVLSLSQAEGFYIHDFLASKGIETYSHVIRSGNSVWYYLRHILHFISFCRKNKIEIVYSHLEPANFVAAIAQFFIPGKIYICRHHIDEASLYNFQYSIFYRITYALAKKIIVVSDHAKRFMITREGIRPEKIIHIDLAYDFDFFPTPSEAEIGAIRARHKDSIILLTACRLTKFKRPDLSVLVLRRLIDSGLNAKLIILGTGPEETNLIKMIDELKLGSDVEMPGYTRSIQDYMGASDFFLHPSVLESSSVVIKEAALTNLSVIVCQGIGDFDEYIIHNQNGFVVSAENFVSESATLIMNLYLNKSALRIVGLRLNEDVRRRFSIRNILPVYSRLNQRG